MTVIDPLPIYIQATHQIADDANEWNVAGAFASDKGRKKQPHGSKNVTVAGMIADDAAWSSIGIGGVSGGMHTCVAYGHKAQA